MRFSGTGPNLPTGDELCSRPSRFSSRLRIILALWYHSSSASRGGFYCASAQIDFESAGPLPPRYKEGRGTSAPARAISPLALAPPVMMSVRLAVLAPTVPRSSSLAARCASGAAAGRLPDRVTCLRLNVMTCTVFFRHSRLTRQPGF